MRWIAASQQMRDLDRAAIHEEGIPSTDLMERAAEALAETAMELAEEAREPVSGKGLFLPEVRGEVSIITPEGTAACTYTKGPPVPGEPLRAAVFSGQGMHHCGCPAAAGGGVRRPVLPGGGAGQADPRHPRHGGQIGPCGGEAGAL